MDALSLGGVATLVLGLILTVLNIREKLWPRRPAPHPLTASLDAIAVAIREDGEPSDLRAAVVHLERLYLDLARRVPPLPPTGE